jgi:hypothetical protein
VIAIGVAQMPGAGLARIHRRCNRAPASDRDTKAGPYAANSAQRCPGGEDHRPGRPRRSGMLRNQYPAASSTTAQNEADVHEALVSETQPSTTDTFHFGSDVSGWTVTATSPWPPDAKHTRADGHETSGVILRQRLRRTP